ncbi:MAG: hypothetical protein AB1640_21480 [bacterium]
MTAVRCLPVALIALILAGGVGAPAGGAENAIRAWKSWKSIEAAIALHPLDGPDDMLEKVEIIEDRVDALDGERIRLQTEAAQNLERLRALRMQRESLQDLAEIKPGGDPQTRQRLHDLSERTRREEILLELRRESVDELEEELVRMRGLAAAYREKAGNLMIREQGAP